MDLLRTVLQPSFNDDILAVFKKYMKVSEHPVSLDHHEEDEPWIVMLARSFLFLAQFFEKAASNVKENVGEDVQTDQLIKDACRNCLEHVRKIHDWNKLPEEERVFIKHRTQSFFLSRPNSSSPTLRKLRKDLFSIRLWR